MGLVHKGNVVTVEGGIMHEPKKLANNYYLKYVTFINKWKPWLYTGKWYVVGRFIYLHAIL